MLKLLLSRIWIYQIALELISLFGWPVRILDVILAHSHSHLQGRNSQGQIHGVGLVQGGSWEMQLAGFGEGATCVSLVGCKHPHVAASLLRHS